jgi:hypothetical protein
VRRWRQASTVAAAARPQRGALRECSRVASPHATSDLLILRFVKICSTGVLFVIKGAGRRPGGFGVEVAGGAPGHGI